MANTGIDFSFLDTVKPALTLFGNAKSEHLAYDKWANRGLAYVTNNQAGNVILDPDQDSYLRVYVTCQKFAEAYARITS
jgi:competence protein ComEC